MATHRTDVPEDDPARPSDRFPAGFTGVTLAALLALGVVAWRDTDRPGPTARDGRPAVPLLSPTATAATSSVTAPPWYLEYGAGPTWYLVASPQQAEVAGEILSYRNKTLLMEGKPLPAARVLVVDSPQAAHAHRIAAAVENAIRCARGAPAVTVIDLRAARSSPRAARRRRPS